MLSKLCEVLYLKVLVNIVIAQSKTTVYIEMLNQKGLVRADKEEFDTKYLSTQMYEYIQSFTKESPNFYVSILDNSTSQGLIPTCSKQRVGYYYDVSDSEYKCYKQKWTYYTSKNDLYNIERVYEKIGVDFIFSPFIVLSKFFQDKIDTHLAIFILIEEGSISLSIFKNSELLYGNYINISIDTSSDELEIDDIEIDIEEDKNSIDLDDVNTIDDLDALDDIDELDELDDFSDIADLDLIEEIDEFSEAKDIEEELIDSESAEEFPIEESDGLNEDYQRFIFIQQSVNDFYKNGKYDSEFVENIYIADSIGVSTDLKKYLEEEMFLNVYIRHINLVNEVCDIAKMESE